MTIALIALSGEGRRIAARLAKHLDGADVYVHTAAAGEGGGAGFQCIKNLTRNIFHNCSGLVYVAPCGVVVRAIAPLLRHKSTDPAVVVVDAGSRYAISLLSGHEGGANDLAFKVANIIGAEPVISTTTEALKDLIVGVGCRRGAAADSIVAAVREALERVGADAGRIRMLASADIKMQEHGLAAAAESLGVNLRFISSSEINSTKRKFRRSRMVAARVNLPAVAEPSALLAGRRTKLILQKSIIHGVTVAIAREHSL